MMEQRQNTNLAVQSKRIGACFLDFLISVIIAFILCNILQHLLGLNEDNYWLGLTACLFAYIYMIFRDFVFGDASIGKRVLHLHVVSEIGDQKPFFSAMIKRNLTLFLAGVEILLFLLYGWRLGDTWSHTTVVQK